MTTEKNKSLPQIDKLEQEYKLEITAIHRAVSSIEDTPSSSPSLDYIRGLVRVEVEKKEARQKKALISFIILAICVITTMISLCLNNPVLLLGIQIASLTGIPLAVFKFSKKAGVQ